MHGPRPATHAAAMGAHHVNHSGCASAAPAASTTHSGKREVICAHTPAKRSSREGTPVGWRGATNSQVICIGAGGTLLAEQSVKHGHAAHMPTCMHACMHVVLPMHAFLASPAPDAKHQP